MMRASLFARAVRLCTALHPAWYRVQPFTAGQWNRDLPDGGVLGGSVRLFCEHKKRKVVVQHTTVCATGDNNRNCGCPSPLFVFLPSL